MEGAEALSLPLKQGQSLSVSRIEDEEIRWQSLEQGHEWFKARFGLPDLRILTEKNSIATALQRLLSAASRMNPEALPGKGGIEVLSESTFMMQWGFGSSSTLVSNIAYWFDVDPMELFFKVYQGSGYDIATARSDKPIFYRLLHQVPFIETVDFKPSFAEQLYFVYLGEKQNTAESIDYFRKKASFTTEDLEKISKLTRQIAGSTDIDEFETLIQEHEAIISGILGRAPVKEILFRDLPATVKSLGSWGGDFALVCWHGDHNELSNYLGRMGFDTIFTYSELVAW